MKLLVVGASGLVGSALVRQAAAAGHTVIGLIGRWPGPVPGATDLHRVDLAEGAAASRLVQTLNADVLINAAAISEPAACEANPALAERVNVALPAALAGVAAEAGARFIHFSSEQVFDGTQPPYAPEATPHPLNLYGRQKVASERAVLTAGRRAAIVRSPLLLGNSLSGRRSVHEKLFELWAGGGVARLFADEYRQVCTAESLAAAALELAGRPEISGALHWAGRDLVSRHELGLRLAAKFGVPARLIEKVWRAETPEASAKRAANLSLQLAPLDRTLRVQPESLDEALRTLMKPAPFRDWMPPS